MRTQILKDNNNVKLNIVILLLIIIAVIPQVLSQEIVLETITTESCLNPNSLSTETIKKCLEKKFIQPSQLSDEKLAETLKDYLEISEILEDKDLVRAINKDFGLLDKEKIFGEFDNRTVKDIKILNDNKNIKVKWFKKYNITDKGCNLISYNGTRIQTNKIVINDKEKVKGLNLTANCEGIISNITIKKGNFSFTNNSIIISNGEINITGNQNKTIKAEKTKVFIKKELYESLNYFNLTARNNSVKIQGEVARFNTENNTLISTTNNQVEYKENETLVGQNTTMWLYEKNKLYLKIKTDNKAKIGRNCAGEDNCIKIENDPTDELYSIYLNVINDSIDVKKYVDQEINIYKIRNFGLTSENNPLTTILIEISYMKTISDKKKLLEYSLYESAPISADLTSQGSQEASIITNFFGDVYDQVLAGKDSLKVLSDIENKTKIKIFDSNFNSQDELQNPIFKFLMFVKNSNLDSEQLRSEINKLNLSFKKQVIVNSTEGIIEITDINDTITTLNISFGLQNNPGGNIIFSKQGKTEAQINKTKLDIKGNPKNFKVNIESDYLNSKKEEHKLKYDFGEVSMHSDWKIVGYYSSKRKKPEKILTVDTKRLYELTVGLRDDHVKKIIETGVGTHYGSLWKISTRDSAKIINTYKNDGFDLKEASCVGYPLEVLDLYYGEVGGEQLAFWNEVRIDALRESRKTSVAKQSKNPNKQGFNGIGFAKALVKVGWKVYIYGNPTQSGNEAVIFRRFKKYGKFGPTSYKEDWVDADGFINSLNPDFSNIGLYAFGGSHGGGHVWNIVGGSSEDYIVYEVHWGYGPTEDELYEGYDPARSGESNLLKNWVNYNFGFIVVPPESPKENIAQYYSNPSAKNLLEQIYNINQ